MKKQYTFKDGFKCIASTREEAIKKHKATLPKTMIIENDWIPKVKDLVKYDGDLCIRITKDDLDALIQSLGEKYLKQYNLISKDKNYLKILSLDDMDKFWIYPLAKDYFRKKTNCNEYYWAKNLKELQEIMGEKVLDQVLSGIKFLLKKTNKVATKKSAINKKLQSIAKRMGVPPYSHLVKASSESKQFYYKGQIITAKSKEEAINKIIAEKSTQTETVNSAVVRFTFEDPFMNNHNFEEKINLGKAVSKKDALILAKKELLNGIDIKNDEVGGRFNNYQTVTLSYKGRQLGKWKDNPPFNKFTYNGSAYTNSRKDRLIEINEIKV